LKPLELARLGFFRRVGVATLAFGFFFGLIAKVGDGDPVTEDVIAAKSQLGFGFLRQAVAKFGQFLDQGVEGRMILDVDNFFDPPTLS